jgi:hypothetical protein
MSFVGKAISAVTEPIFGGGQKAQASHSGITTDEVARLNDIESKIGDLYKNQPSQVGLAQKDQQIQDLFRDHLIDFMSGAGKTEPTPEQLAQATDFVDKTFTAPTQTALNQYQSDFTDQQNARAAALGRNPNADIATQQAIFGEGQRNTMNLQNQRGAQIQQQAMGLNQLANDRSLQGLSAGMQGVNQGLQTSGFLNSLQQQAMLNRMNLLNQKTGIANFYQADRGIAGYGTNPGILGNISSGLGQISGIGQQAGNIANSGGLAGIGSNISRMF